MNKRQQINYLLDRPEPSPSTVSPENDITNEPRPSTSRAIEDNTQNVSHHKNIRFDDIQNSFRTFDGKSNVHTWINQFLEQSEIFQFTALEKFVDAKKLLVEIAALWVRHESTATNFVELIAELKTEFHQKANSALIHEK